ncbi:hypothetical protein GCM10023257_69970 [Streptomyces hyderabadensis]|uniref:Uncharacterized protein n=1 Tax=Streptomyces hyderabadensis TaxID=598549 RepID=A0ABP9IY68_9ACTN
MAHFTCEGEHVSDPPPRRPAGACERMRADAGDMSGRRPIVVGRPSPSGGGRVRADGVTLGLAYGPRDIAEFLRRAGLENIDVETSDLIVWRGGGPDVWAHESRPGR